MLNETGRDEPYHTRYCDGALRVISLSVLVEVLSQPLGSLCFTLS